MILWCRNCDEPMEYSYRQFHWPNYSLFEPRPTCGPCSIAALKYSYPMRWILGVDQKDLDKALKPERLWAVPEDPFDPSDWFVAVDNWEEVLKAGGWTYTWDRQEGVKVFSKRVPIHPHFNYTEVFQ